MPSIQLTKEQLLKHKRETADIDLPELGGVVRITSFSAKDTIRAQELSELRAKGEDVTDRMTRLILSAAIVGPDGKKMFDEESVGELLETLSPETTSQLGQAVGELNRKARTKEAPPGNSEASQSGS